MEPFWLQGWRRFGLGLIHFFLNMIIKEKTAPPSKVALFSKTAVLAPLFSQCLSNNIVTITILQDFSIFMYYRLVIAYIAEIF